MLAFFAGGQRLPAWGGLYQDRRATRLGCAAMPGTFAFGGPPGGSRGPARRESAHAEKRSWGSASVAAQPSHQRPRGIGDHCTAPPQGGQGAPYRVWGPVSRVRGPRIARAGTPIAPLKNVTRSGVFAPRTVLPGACPTKPGRRRVFKHAGHICRRCVQATWPPGNQQRGSSTNRFPSPAGTRAPIWHLARRQPHAAGLTRHRHQIDSDGEAT